MAGRSDSPFGVTLRGGSRGIAFVRPYRRVNELNQVERWKLDRHPLEVADAVIEEYARQGIGAIAKVPGEAERLKWVGLYPQRQGGDAFMLRVKVPGGILTAAQAHEIGIAAEAYAEGPDDSPVFGNRYADITTRQDIQMHWLRIEDIPRLWQRFADVGLTTIQACGDSARNVLCCPLSGVDADEVFDAGPVARAISDFFTGNREYANLPRKFKMSVTGCVEDCAQAEIQDVGLWPARTEDGTLGLNVLVGGGLSDGERMASDIDVFVRLDQAVELTRAVAQVFGELGNRENRGMSRMRYLVQELGPEGFRHELAQRVRFDLHPAGEELTRRYRGDHVGVHAQRQPGLVAVGCSVAVGRLTGAELVEAARLARTYGDGTIRLGTDQNFVLTGVGEGRLDDLLAEELLAKHSPFPGPFERGVVACTGNEFCRFAVVETKERAVRWARFLDRHLEGDGDRHLGDDLGGDGDRHLRGEGIRSDRGIIRMHLSGCSASCAQPQIADVGLRGSTAHVGGHVVEAVDVGLGGSLGLDAGFIDWVEGGLPADEAPAALVRLVQRYGEERQGDEEFVTWARRVDNHELRQTIRGVDVARWPAPADAPASAPAPRTKGSKR